MGHLYHNNCWDKATFEEISTFSDEVGLWLVPKNLNDPILK